MSSFWFNGLAAVGQARPRQRARFHSLVFFLLGIAGGGAGT